MSKILTDLPLLSNVSMVMEIVCKRNVDGKGMLFLVRLYVGSAKYNDIGENNRENVTLVFFIGYRVLLLRSTVFFNNMAHFSSYTLFFISTVNL